MLDIEYIKQIDEVLEVQGCQLDEQFCTGVGIIIGKHLRFEIDHNGMFSGEKELYGHYLSRVIEAINKKNFNEGSYSFSYQILTEIDNYHVYDKYKEKTLERFYFGKRHDYDTKKEQAIIYIMDHIAKNNCK